jgi:hypothetical protein
MEQDTYVEKDSYTARIRRIEKTFFRLYRIHFGNHASNTLCFAGVGPQKNLILARSSNNPGIRARTSRRPGADCRAHHSKTFQDTHSASGDGSWAPHSYGALGFNSRRLQNANWLFKSEGLPRRWRPLSLSHTHTHTQTHTHTHTHPGPLVPRFNPIYAPPHTPTPKARGSKQQDAPLNRNPKKLKRKAHIASSKRYKTRFRTTNQERAPSEPKRSHPCLAS